MPNIFSTQAGRVTQLSGGGLMMDLKLGDNAAPELYGAWRGFNGFRSIITGLSIQQQSGFQLLHTLNQYIYIYSFGERAADLMIGGLAFLVGCNDAIDADGRTLNKTGLEHVLSFYKANRLSTRGIPVNIAIGSSVAFKAILVGQKIDLSDPQTNTSQFSLSLKALPF